MTSQASRLVGIARDAGADLFHDASGVGYATVPVRDHHETHPIRSAGFGDWLRREHLRAEDAGPNGQALADARATLGALARFDGPSIPVHVRVAGHGGNLYLDLADDGWRVVEVRPEGWRILDRSPVRFRRPPAMLALPAPLQAHERHGGLELLRGHLNIGTEAAWRLIVGWLLGACRSVGPYPVLVLHGEQGSAKSWAARLLRATVDPNRSPLRSDPRDLDALMIAATNGWVPVFDNLSAIPAWVSDGLCRLATGGGLSKRTLYTDDDETIIDATRPVIIDGIAELATRGDLADRSIVVEMPRIAEGRRRTEAAILAAFGRDHPAILGGLLDVLASALAAAPHVTLDRMPRMADFAVWAVAAEPALGWPRGSFLAAYAENRASAHEVAVESSPVATAIRELAEGIVLVPDEAAIGPAFEGTAGELLDLLAERLGERRVEALTKRRAWPTSPRSLGDALRRVAPNLRALGIEVTFSRAPGGMRDRLVTVTRARSRPTVPTVPTVPPSTSGPPIPGRSGRKRDGGGTKTSPPDGPSPSTSGTGGTVGTKNRASLIPRAATATPRPSASAARRRWRPMTAAGSAPTRRTAASRASARAATGSTRR